MVMEHEEFTPEEFRKRTWKILEQYEKAYKASPETFYDVTLAVNCLFGLLIEPTEEFWKNLPTEKKAITFFKDKGITDCILIEALNKNSGDISAGILLKDFIIGLRNGLAHWGSKPDARNHNTDGTRNVDYKKNDKGVVEKVRITGTLHNFTTTVTATFCLFNKDGKADNSISKFLKLVASETCGQQAQPQENQNTATGETQ
jgi:hypothetical protein